MIYIDDRTGSVEMASHFQSHRTRPAVSLTRLPAADFAFSGNGPTGPCMIGIERKRTKDMLSSIRTGRFSGEQLPKLLDHYEFPFLLVEGWIRTNYQTGELEEWWGKKWCAVHSGSQRQAFLALELDSFLSTIELHTRVRVHRTLNEQATTEDVINLQGYFAKPWDKHHAHIALHTPPEFATLGKASTTRRVAAALNQIGWTRSAAVAEHFGTVEDMVNAPVKEWMKIDGFGRVLSRKVWDELHGTALHSSGDGLE